MDERLQHQHGGTGKDAESVETRPKLACMNKQCEDERRSRRASGRPEGCTTFPNCLLVTSPEETSREARHKPAESSGALRVTTNTLTIAAHERPRPDTCLPKTIHHGSGNMGSARTGSSSEKVRATVSGLRAAVKQAPVNE